MKIRCGLTGWVLVAAIVITSANAGNIFNFPNVIEQFLKILGHL